MKNTFLFLVLLCGPALSAQVTRPRPLCGAPGVARDREDCVRARVDSTDAAFDRELGRVVEVLPDSARKAFLETHRRWYDGQHRACRARAEGPLDITPASPVFAQCMADAIRRRLDELARSYPSSRVAAAGHGGCLAYEPDTVALTGVLDRRTYPGRPNYESIAHGDEAETGFYLSVPHGLCATRNLDEINGAVAGVQRIQLVLDQRGYDRLRQYLGQSVTVRGTLFHSHTGHHHAELLLIVVK